MVLQVIDSMYSFRIFIKTKQGLMQSILKSFSEIIVLLLILDQVYDCNLVDFQLNEGYYIYYRVPATHRCLKKVYP